MNSISLKIINDLLLIYVEKKLKIVKLNGIFVYKAYNEDSVEK